MDGTVYQGEQILGKVPEDHRLRLINCYPPPFQVTLWNFNRYFLSELKNKVHSWVAQYLKKFTLYSCLF